jgi:hypothetical protein
MLSPPLKGSLKIETGLTMKDKKKRSSQNETSRSRSDDRGKRLTVDVRVVSGGLVRTRSIEVPL